MNIEQVREYALSLSKHVTEDMFADPWISWRIAGKWFMLMQLAAHEQKALERPLSAATRRQLRQRADKGILPSRFEPPPQIHPLHNHEMRKRRFLPIYLRPRS